MNTRKTIGFFCGLITGLFILTGCMSKQNDKVGGSDFLKNYFVAQLDANADDSNPGTEDKPFKSINGALTKLKLKPGDAIWIKNGIYRETVNLQPEPIKRFPNAKIIPSGKNYSQMITIAAYPNHKPVIKGSDIVTDWKKYKDDIWVRDNWTINSQQLFSDGKILEQIGGKMADGFVSNAWGWKHKGKKLDDMIPGSFYYDIENKRLYSWLKDNGDPNQHLMEAATREKLICIGEGLEYIRITGLTLRHGNNFSFGFALPVLGSHCVIEDVDQAWHSFGGGAASGEYITFSRCKFNFNGNSGMGGRKRGHKILNCETNYNNYRNWSFGWHSGGCKFIPKCHDWIIKGHVSAYNNGDGIWFDNSASNITIEGCRLFRNKGLGIHYEICARATIKNNIIYENGTRGIYLANSSHCLIANNLLYRNGMGGIVCIGVKRRGNPLYTRGEDNVMPGGSQIVVGNILVDNCWDASRNLKKYPGLGNGPELLMPADFATNGSNFSDYNIFYRSGKRDNEKLLRFARNWDQNFARGLDDWREKTGWDKHSIYVKPLFVNERERDFHPSDKCPSLWFVEKPDMCVFYDFDDKLRPGWDAPRTAGPYGGNAKLFEQMKKKPKTKGGKYCLFPLPKYGKVNPFFRQAQGAELKFAEDFGWKKVSPLILGTEIGETPFALTRKGGIILSPVKPETVIKPDVSVSEMYFLMTALDYGTKAFAQCVISRGDGVKINIEWQGDGKGGITTNSDKKLSSKQVWSGKSKYWSRATKKHATKPFNVYLTTWKNDNEWIAIEKCEFKLLDPKAKAAIFAISGKSAEK